MVSATVFASKVRGEGQLQQQDGQWPVSRQRQDTTSFIPLACHISGWKPGGWDQAQNLQAVHTFVSDVNKFAPNCVFILDIAGLRFEFVNTSRTLKLAPCNNLFVISYVCGFYQQLLLSVIARGNCHQSLLASLS